MAETHKQRMAEYKAKLEQAGIALVELSPAALFGLPPAKPKRRKARKTKKPAPAAPPDAPVEQWLCPACKGDAVSNSVECSECKRWFHFSCANFNAKSRAKSKRYTCPLCPSPACRHCNENIANRHVDVLGTRFHSDHVFCSLCNTKLQHQVYVKKETFALHCASCISKAEGIELFAAEAVQAEAQSEQFSTAQHRVSESQLLLRANQPQQRSSTEFEPVPQSPWRTDIRYEQPIPFRIPAPNWIDAIALSTSDFLPEDLFEIFYVNPHVRFGYRYIGNEVLPKGKWVCCYIGEVIDSATSTKRIRSGVGDYIAQLDYGLYVDALVHGGLCRFINHMCVPNCKMSIVLVDGNLNIGIQTISPISPNEELGTDYGWTSRDPRALAFGCHCGKLGCTGTLINRNKTEKQRKMRNLSTLV